MAQDYSQWLTPERLRHEEEVWSEAPHERAQAELVAAVCREHALRSVVEFGCATGWQPSFLDGSGPETQYLGIDANPYCLDLARAKCPGRLFLQGDIRTVAAPPADLVVSFAVLKHFHLSEWDAILTRILSFGRFGLVSVTIADRNIEDDCDFPHVWLTQERLQRVVEGAGHAIIATPWSTEVPSEWMVVTRRNCESAALPSSPAS